MADGGFDSYYAHHSTTALFYVNGQGNPNLFNLRPQHHSNPDLNAFTNLLSFIPRPFKILSSSSGFILCRDPSCAAYHIFNPLSDPLFGHTILPIPPRPHPIDTPAVIAFDDNLHDHYIPTSTTTSYYVVCAVNNQRVCTFDSFCSFSGEWNTHPDTIMLRDHTILGNTGVSCRGCAYWLTDREPGREAVVIMHDPRCTETSVARLREIMEDVMPCRDVRMQLGRIGNSLSIVIADGFLTRLYLLLRNGVDEVWRWGCRGVTTELAVTTGQETARPLRFESFKVEIVFSMGGRLVIWESSDVWYRLTRVRMLARPQDLSEEDIGNIGDAVPFILPPAFLPSQVTQERFLNIRIEIQILVTIVILIFSWLTS